VLGDRRFGHSQVEPLARVGGLHCRTTFDILSSVSSVAADEHNGRSDGKRNYKISNDHVVKFLIHRGGIYAIEGMDHMSLTCGSVIQIARQRPLDHWRAARVVRLPWAPTAAALKGDGTMLIALSNAFVALKPNRDVQMLIDEAPWENLYPSSAILTPDALSLFGHAAIRR